MYIVTVCNTTDGIVEVSPLLRNMACAVGWVLGNSEAVCAEMKGNGLLCRETSRNLSADTRTCLRRHRYITFGKDGEAKEIRWDVHEVDEEEVREP